MGNRGILSMTVDRTASMIGGRPSRARHHSPAARFVAGAEEEEGGKGKGQGKQWRGTGWLGSRHADEHGQACVDKLWVPPACE